MKRSVSWIPIAASLSMILLLRPVTASAQSIWTSQTQQNSLTIEWLKPNFEGGEDLSFLTSALFLSGRVAVSDRLRVVGEVPFAHLGIGNETETALGNPYLGVELGHWGASSSSVWAEMGIRAPLASSDDGAVLTGVFADLDRLEAFVPDALSLVALGNYHYRSPSGFSARLRGGPSVLVNTNKGEFEDGEELSLVYSAQGWYEAGPMQVGAGLTGRMLVTERDPRLLERPFHHAGLSVVGTFGKIQPGIHLRVPVDKDVQEFLDFVAGLSVTLLLD